MPFILFPLIAFSLNWQVSTIDSDEDVGPYSSIAYDSLGRPHISYTNLTTGRLKYAYFNGSTWTITTIGTGGASGYYPSLALDSNNHPHISHYNATYGRLLYTKEGTSTLIEGGKVGKFSSLRLDKEGYPNISYYDESKKALKYAFWTGSEWATQTIDYATSSDRGRFSSLFLLENELPCISYYDATAGDLRFAWWNMTHWGSRTIDTIGDVGQYSSLIGKDGVLYIAYYDATNTNLKCAINREGTWTLSTVDSLGDVGKYCSIAVDGSNTAYISYYDATNKDLKIAWGSSTWQNETIDSVGDVGMYSAIVISSNTIHISYYDFTNGNLKYATLGTPTIPNPPSNLSAFAISSSTINLAWSDNSINELWFVVERGTSNTFFEVIGTTTQATYTSTNLSSLTTYYYRVCAYNLYGTSPYSNIASATTFDIAPIAPSNLMATATGSSSITISWDDNSSNELWFVMERGSTITSFAYLGTTTQATYTDTGLLPNTTYYYRVYAWNLTGGSSSYSNIASSTTFLTFLYLSPSYVVIGSGSTRTVNVMIGNASNLVGVSIYLSFNPNVLSVGTITQGAFPPGASFISSSFNNASGTLIYSAGLFSGSATGFGTLATIEFIGTNIGSSAISFKVSTNPLIEETNLIDNNGANLPFNFINGSASVSIPGDADGSGQVNLLDFYILRSEFGLVGPELASDFNHDGTVDLFDFYILRENFGRTRTRSKSERLNRDVLLSIVPGKEAFEVKIANVSSLIAITIDVLFDPNVIEVLSIEKGEFLKEASILEEKITQGKIKYTLALLFGEKEGTGSLAVIKFKEKKGKTSIVFGQETRLMDSSGKWIEYKKEEGEINILGSNSAQVKIEPQDSTIFIEGTKTIGISIRAEGLLGANIELLYDKLEVLRIEKGDFSDVFLFLTQTTKITLVGAKLGSPTTGLVTLANITFKAKEEGRAGLLFSLVDLRDKDNAKITSEAFPGTITIRKYLVGDLNKDGEINFDDLMKITTHWKKRNSEYDIGPAEGIPPNLIPKPDGIIDFEDLMVFCLMWNYKNLKTKTQNAKLPIVWMEKENGDFVIKYSGFSNCLGVNLNLIFEGELSTQTSIPTFLSYQEKGRLNLAIFFFHSLPPSGIMARIKADRLKIESVDLRDYENKKIPVEVKEIRVESLKDSYCYPNPSKEGYIKFKTPANTSLTIYNIAGELVFEEKNLTPDVPIFLNLASGVYIYILQNGKEKKIGKLGIIK